MIFLIINKSIELYSLAANTGNDAAQIILEDAYMNSDGVKKDVERRPQIKEMK
jgi:TPR repeat protein